MAERIETLLTAERRLLMDISHELRSPLARLGVAVELARSGEDRDSMLDRIEKEAERLNELVGELLHVTRVEGDPSQRKTETVYLDELLGEVVEDCRIEAKMKGCSIEWKSAEAGAAASGDEELLRRAFENASPLKSPAVTPFGLTATANAWPALKLPAPSPVKTCT